MRNSQRKKLYAGIFLLILFVLWTVAIKFIDVKAIGPQDSLVGFATVNQFVHNLTGVNMSLYNITDWLSGVPVLFVVFFASVGLIQLVKRKSILKVNRNIVILGFFYAVVFAVYMFFEFAVINYRPVLIDGVLEASYPSSTTMLVMCIMPTVILQLNNRIKNMTVKILVFISVILYILFMVFGRLISGVHWSSDIIGGVIISSALVLIYSYFSKLNFSER